MNTNDEIWRYVEGGGGRKPLSPTATRKLWRLLLAIRAERAGYENAQRYFDEIVSPELMARELAKRWDS